MSAGVGKLRVLRVTRLYLRLLFTVPCLARGQLTRVVRMISRGVSVHGGMPRVACFV